MAIVLAFAVFLVLYFAFSADKGDGLEKTMEDSGTSEGEPLYKAPFSYGEDYPAALAAGVFGIFATLGFVILIGRLIKKAQEKGSAGGGFRR